MTHLMDLIRVMFMLDLLEHHPLNFFTNDDIGPSQVGNAPPQNPPSIIPTFGTFVDTSSMGIRGNIAIELPHTYATNFLGVFGKAMGNKRRRLSGDMASTFRKLIES